MDIEKTPSYDIEVIILNNYNEKTKKIILSKLKKYTKLMKFYCSYCNLTELPELPISLIKLDCSNNNLIELPDLSNSLIELYCHNNNLRELPDLPNSLTELYCDCVDNKLYLTYPNLEIETINETNSKKRIIKRMKLLNRTLLLEHSARICMNPKRIKRLLDTNEIDFYDSSFDTLTS